jgi:DNA-binding NtrC family response regulator
VAAAPKSAGIPKAAASLCVLVIDDERRIGETLRQLLEPDHRVEVTTSIGQARARLAAGPEPDVILCDLMMPDGTGMDLYEELQKSAPSILSRMIFMTGGAFTPRAREFSRQPGITCIEKPFNLDALEKLMLAKAR